MTAPQHRLAEQLLHVADELAEQESCIRAALLEAARRGDCKTIERLLMKWSDGPVSDVLEAAPRRPGEFD